VQAARAAEASFGGQAPAPGARDGGQP